MWKVSFRTLCLGSQSKKVWKSTQCGKSDRFYTQQHRSCRQSCPQIRYICTNKIEKKAPLCWSRGCGHTKVVFPHGYEGDTESLVRHCCLNRCWPQWTMLQLAISGEHKARSQRNAEHDRKDSKMAQNGHYRPCASVTCGVTGEPRTLQLRQKHVEGKANHERPKALVSHRGQITKSINHSINHCSWEWWLMQSIGFENYPACDFLSQKGKRLHFNKVYFGKRGKNFWSCDQPLRGRDAG